MDTPKKIVITGAPSAGKTTLYRTLLHDFSGIMLGVPEIPSIFLDNGLNMQKWKYLVEDEFRNLQFIREIVNTRLELENSFYHVAALAEIDWILCDRSVVDAASYLFPNYHARYNNLTGRSLAQDLSRYQVLIQIGIGSYNHFCNNREIRHTTPSYEAAMLLEENLKKICKKHNYYYYFPACCSLKEQIKKVKTFLSKYIFSYNGANCV